MPGPSSRSGRARLLMLWSSLLVPVMLAASDGPALAQTSGYRCWTRPHVVMAGSLLPLRCRVGGAILVEYPVRPVALYPSVAEDLHGECWYERDERTGWQIVSIGPDGAAMLERHLGGWSGGPAVRLGPVRRCVNEPAVSLDERLVWQVIRGHHFLRPLPSLDPLRGVTGLPAYLDLFVAGPVFYVFDNRETLEQLTLSIAVSQVGVDWGDGGEPLRYRPGAHATSGYPDGTVHHMYDSAGLVRVVVTFEWDVRWRRDGGPWHPVDVAPSFGTFRYYVDQIVARVIR